jgi:DNA-directed RNA polymerase subunit RPC12/RpoP
MVVAGDAMTCNDCGREIEIPNHTPFRCLDCQRIINKAVADAYVKEYKQSAKFINRLYRKERYKGV